MILDVPEGDSISLQWSFQTFATEISDVLDLYSRRSRKKFPTFTKRSHTFLEMITDVPEQESIPLRWSFQNFPTWRFETFLTYNRFRYVPQDDPNVHDGDSRHSRRDSRHSWWKFQTCIQRRFQKSSAEFSDVPDIDSTSTFMTMAADDPEDNSSLSSTEIQILTDVP